MKVLSLLKFSITAMIAVFVAGCAIDSVETLVPQATENPDHEIIRALGFNTDGIEEMEDSYVVEGDIVLDKDALSSGYLPKTRQGRDIYTHLTLNTVSNIKVYINPNVSSVWRTAVQEAIQEWNDIEHCSIYFTIVTSGHQVEVYRNPSVNTAQAALPSSNTRPGRTLEIGSGFDNESASFKKYAMVHEFGHIIGIVHTDWESDNSPYDGIQIVGTPDQYDPLSVMNHNAAGVSGWTDFSPGDLVAAQTLYGTPIWSQSISGPSTCLSSNPSTYTLSLGTNYTITNVSWYVNNTLRQSGMSLSYTPSSTILEPISTTIKAVATFAYGAPSVTVMKTIDITYPNQISIQVNKMQASAGETVYFSVLSPNPGKSYEWQEFGTTIVGQTGQYLALTAPTPTTTYSSSGVTPETNAERPAGVFLVRCREVGTMGWSNEILIQHGLMVN